MQLDDKIEIQTFAMMNALDARLAADPRTAGLTLPQGFRYEPMGSEQAHVRYGVGWHQRGGPDRREASPEHEIAAYRDAWDRMEPETVSAASLDMLEGHAHRAMRMSVQACMPFHAPTWATLVHPVLLALLLSHEPDRSIMPLGTDPRDIDASRRWQVDDLGNPSHTGVNGTVATGECWMEKGVLRCSRMGVITPSFACVTMVCTDGCTRITVPGRLPETIRLADVAGMRIGDLVGLPSSGDAGVDDAAAGCIVKGMDEMPNGTTFDLEAATLIAYGPAPDEVKARAMALAPVIG